MSAGEDPSAECGGEGSVASSGHDKRPEIPSVRSRDEVSTIEGVSTFSLGMLVGDMLFTLMILVRAVVSV